MDNNSWLDKYRPNTLAQVIGSRREIDFINGFIKQFREKTSEEIVCPVLIVSGANGCGKTLVTDLAIRENAFEKKIADLSNITVARKVKRKKGEKDPVGPHRHVNLYYQTLTNSKQLSLTGEFVAKDIVLVIDDVSNISNPKDREIIKALVKINNKHKRFPIIITTNTKHSKTVTELRKLSTITTKRTAANGRKVSTKTINEITLHPPSGLDLEIFIKRIAVSERLVFQPKPGDDDDIYVELIEHSQYDVRRLINSLEDIKLIFSDEPVTLDKLELYLDTSKKKDLDLGIYVATSNLLNHYKGIESTLQLYSEERATIPLMVHENYPRNICTQYATMKPSTQIQLARDISRHISMSDKIDGLIYSNQFWGLQAVHGFYSCVMPSYLINSHPNKKHNTEKYQFTQDYNKTSIKKINNKVIKRAQEHPSFKRVSVNDFLYISSILKSLIEQKDFERIAELMGPYGLKLKEIESIIKIDKINKPKNALTGKQKNTLKSLLGVTE
ncbi:DNA replication factor RFC1 [uncultured virus]|nr:DNA replication factor RFC1 [uncultured virus]